MEHKKELGYKMRNEILRRIGFKSYDRYLASDLWAKIRAVQLRINPTCFGCGNKATQVHHGRYTAANLLGHSAEFLFSVCGGCHFTSEFDKDGGKRSVKEATKTLKGKHRGLKYYSWLHLEMDRECRARWDREE